MNIANSVLDRNSELTITLLGGAGFIGSHLIDYLLINTAWKLVVWDTSSEKIGHRLGSPRLDFRSKDLATTDSRAELGECIAASDAVVNLAAICNPAEYVSNPVAVIRSNFIDIFWLADMCAEANKWLVHFSTSEVYGRTLGSYTGYGDGVPPSLYLLNEDTTPLVMGPVTNQRWSYACAKQLMERYIYACSLQHGLTFTIVRPLNFFGPRMDYIPGLEGDGVPRVLACFMAALLKREPLKLVDGGAARRTIVSIHDAVAAISLILTQPGLAKNQIFHIGNPANEVTIKELAQLMRAIYAEVSGDPTFAEVPIVPVTSEEFYGRGYEDCDRRMPDIEKMRSVFDWSPTTPLRDILRETISYYYDAYGRPGRQPGASDAAGQSWAARARLP